MKNELKELFYNNMKAIYYCEEAIAYFHAQNFYKGFIYYTKIIDYIMLIVDTLIKRAEYFSSCMSEFNINSLLSSILEANERKDYILLTDLLETELVPLLERIQCVLMKEKQDELLIEKFYSNIELLRKYNGTLSNEINKLGFPLLETDYYQIQQTKSGYYTLALYDKGEKYYMHSISSVLHESKLLANEWFNNEIGTYVIYGLGLGYHILSLLELDTDINVTVLESDLSIISLACAFGCFDELIIRKGFRIIYDPSFNKFSESIKTNENSIFYTYYPSIRNIKDDNIRNMVEEYFITYSSIKNQAHRLYSNFKRNIMLNDIYIDILKKEFINKDLFIIAGGPSLDKNFHMLEKINSNGIVLAVGTVLKKLLKAKIKPNYIIVTDPEEFVYTQIEGVVELDIPLIYLSTVYSKIPASYKGQRYLVCQEGYSKAEDYAITKGYHLYKTGGSVVTTALDIGIFFECKRIIFLGLDLAYTDQRDHALDTAYVNSAIYDKSLRQVEDVYGNMVTTGNNLDIYRKWIEKRIEEVKDIEFIDCTEGGAKIKGTKVITMHDLITHD